MAAHNANLVGGDIGVGGNTLWHALAAPTRRLNPWTTPLDGLHLVRWPPPGGGVHGTAGYYAARTVLRREFRHQDVPKLSP